MHEVHQKILSEQSVTGKVQDREESEDVERRAEVIVMVKSVNATCLFPQWAPICYDTELSTKRPEAP